MTAAIIRGDIESSSGRQGLDGRTFVLLGPAPREVLLVQVSQGKEAVYLQRRWGEDRDTQNAGGISKREKIKLSDPRPKH